MAEIIVKKPEKKGVLDPHTVQKIIGVKDFVALPTTPVTPTLNQHLVRKKYVDDNFGPLTLTTNGDILYYNSGHQRLAKGSDGEVLALASGLPSWAAVGGGTPSFWVFPDHLGGCAYVEIGDFIVVDMDDANEYCFMSFGVPTDFASLTSVKLVFIGQTTGETFDWTITTDFGADGELRTAHSDSATADGQAMTTNTLDTLDITAAFTGLAAGDFIGLKLNIDAVSTSGIGMYLIGLEFKYAAATGPATHDLGGASHNADTLANLNTKVSDATLIDVGTAIAFAIVFGG